MADGQSGAGLGRRAPTDNGVSLSGTFVTAAEGYLVLRGAGRKKVFVNQRKVSYFEVEEE